MSFRTAALRRRRQRALVAWLSVSFFALAIVTSVTGCDGRLDRTSAAPDSVPSLANRTLTDRAHTAGPQALLQHEDQFVRLGDVTLRYRTMGAGDPVLLIHGFSDRVEMWAGPADSLARSHRVIVPDVRGFGRSTRFAEPSRYGLAMADDLVSLLDSLQIQRTHVIGYSMGALLASHLSLRAPSRVASVTLVAGPFFRDSVETVTWLSPYIDSLAVGRGLTAFMRAIVPTADAATARQINDDVMAYNDPDALIAVLRSFGALQMPWSAIRQRTQPMVAVVGSADPVLELSQRMVREWPGSRLVEVPDGDHINITNMPAMLAAFRSIARPITVAERNTGKGATPTAGSAATAR